MARSLTKYGRPSSGASPWLRKIRPSKGASIGRSPRGPFEVKQAPQVPSMQCFVYVLSARLSLELSECKVVPTL
jgi:hypothetical protein